MRAPRPRAAGRGRSDQRLVGHRIRRPRPSASFPARPGGACRSAIRAVLSPVVLSSRSPAAVHFRTRCGTMPARHGIAAGRRGDRASMPTAAPVRPARPSWRPVVLRGHRQQSRRVRPPATPPPSSMPTNSSPSRPARRRPSASSTEAARHGYAVERREALAGPRPPPPHAAPSRRRRRARRDPRPSSAPRRAASSAATMPIDRTRRAGRRRRRSRAPTPTRCCPGRPAAARPRSRSASSTPPSMPAAPGLAARHGHQPRLHRRRPRRSRTAPPWPSSSPAPVG